MSRLHKASVTLGFVWAAVASNVCRASDGELLQQAHAWGRFGAGSWRQARIVTENFDDQGQISNWSTTNNRTTLDEVTPERVTLKVEVTVEIAGRRVDSPMQVVKQGYAGENPGQTVLMRPMQPELVRVAGQQISCETRRIEIVGGTNKEITLINYSPRLIPSILRRQSTITDVASGKTTQEAVSEVIELEKERRVLGERRIAYSVRQTAKTDRGTTITESDHVHGIPGEIVWQSSRKLDEMGRLVRRSTLELVGYGVQYNGPYRDQSRARTRRQMRGR